LRTATKSLASETISKESPRSLISSAPASRTTSSSVVLGLVPLGHDDDALAGEQVGDRPGVGEVATVAGQGGAHLGGGPVAVVGEALDEQRHAVGRIALVGDRLPVGAAGLGARAPLDRPVDVVVGDRGLLGLVDRVPEGRVAQRVTATGARRHLDVLDELGEQLAALGVDRRLLVLRGRPLGVAALIR
jgi:hypothetical protein